MDGNKDHHVKNKAILRNTNITCFICRSRQKEEWQEYKSSIEDGERKGVWGREYDGATLYSCEKME
jgi:DNA-directed RNA polymerase subunit N (RpoN/RPB10)